MGYRPTGGSKARVVGYVVRLSSYPLELYNLIPRRLLRNRPYPTWNVTNQSELSHYITVL
eukprot:1192682-Prorocentrum_minimum.AAC.1